MDLDQIDQYNVGLGLGPPVEETTASLIGTTEVVEGTVPSTSALITTSVAIPVGTITAEVEVVAPMVRVLSSKIYMSGMPPAKARADAAVGEDNVLSSFDWGKGYCQTIFCTRSSSLFWWCG